MSTTAPDVREIPLTRGLVALVDADDYPKLSGWKWHASSTPYAKRGFKFAFLLSSVFLRIATVAENRRNSRPSSGKTSRYKGVTLDRQRCAWKASISLGTFDTEEDAARAYDAAAIAIQGAFAWLNRDHFDELGSE